MNPEPRTDQFGSYLTVAGLEAGYAAVWMQTLHFRLKYLLLHSGASRMDSRVMQHQNG